MYFFPFQVVFSYQAQLGPKGDQVYLARWIEGPV